MKKSIATTLTLLSLNLSATESHLDVRYHSQKGVGYETGYTSLDYLLMHRFEKTQLLFDARGHVFNNERFAANGGLGFRYSCLNTRLVAGANLFYDFRNDSHIIAHQGGAGLEFLNKHADLRFNGYYPFGGKRSYDRRSFKRFEGNEIIVKQKIVSTLPKAEMEIGLPWKHWYLAGGPYYLFKQKSHGSTLGNAWGGSLRLKLGIGKHLWIEGQATYDSIFKMRGQGVVSVRIFDIPAKSKEKQRSLCSRPIYRSEIIPLQKKTREVALYEGHEGDSFKLVFVRNNFIGGNGTFEAPFSSLKDAEANSKPGDIIYVFPGDGTATNMDEGIVLKEDQMLVSSGSPLEIGDMIIPPMTPGEMPMITNIHPDEPVVSNPGSSNLDNFRIVEPWEYLLDWGANGVGVDVDAGGPAPDAIPVGMPGPQNLEGSGSDSESFEDLGESDSNAGGSSPELVEAPDEQNGPPGGDFVPVENAGDNVESGSDHPEAPHSEQEPWERLSVDGDASDPDGFVVVQQEQGTEHPESDSWDDLGADDLGPPGANRVGTGDNDDAGSDSDHED